LNATSLKTKAHLPLINALRFLNSLKRSINNTFCYQLMKRGDLACISFCFLSPVLFHTEVIGVCVCLIGLVYFKLTFKSI